jgi:fatty acid desaturase
VKEAGLLGSQPGYYVVKTAVAVGTLAAVTAVALIAANAWLVLACAVLLGFASTQIALLSHDVAHRQCYRGGKTNLIARVVFGNILLGVSHSWWTVKHNQHHATPNHVDLDPDIQFPMVVFREDQIASRHPFFRPMIAIQAFLFVFLLPFQALNMKLSSLDHLRTKSAKHPWVQGFFIAVHHALYVWLCLSVGGIPLAIGFFAVHQAVFGLYNSSVFASNHKGMPLTDDATRMDFLREQVLTSRNINGHPLLDFWYGGLNYQVEHHLFPTMPRNNLAKAQVMVEQFCSERGIAYHSTSLFEGYRETFSHLHRVGASLRVQEPRISAP